MSDNGQWQSPGGSPLPPPPPFAGYGPSAPHPPGATPGESYGAWTPPPRPGLIPLRPLGLGDILGSSFRVLRRNPRPIVGIALLLKGIVALITLAIVGLITVEGLTHVLDTAGGSSVDAGLNQFTLGSLLQSGVSSLVTLTLGLVADAILQGIITLEVARGSLGEKLSLGALWSYARGRILALVGWSAIVGGIVLGVSLVVIGIVTALVVAGGTAGIVIGVLLGLVSGLAFIVIGAWLWIKLSLVTSVIVLERKKIREAVRRSWQLTRGFFWRTLGIELLVVAIIYVATSIVLTPVTIVISFITLTTGTSTTAGPTDAVTYLTFTVTTVLTAIIGALTAVISTAAISLIYIDLRIRKEGLDLDLLRYTEQRENGETDLANPYLTLSFPTPI